MPGTKKTFVEADNNALRTLTARLGVAETAKQLGVANSTIHAMSKNDKVQLRMELAARHLLSKLDKSASEPKVVLARVPADKVEVVRQFLEAVGAKHQCV